MTKFARFIAPIIVNVQPGDCGEHRFYLSGVLEASTYHTCPTTSYRSTGSYGGTDYAYLGTEAKGCWGSPIVGCAYRYVGY